MPAFQQSADLHYKCVGGLPAATSRYLTLPEAGGGMVRMVAPSLSSRGVLASQLTPQARCFLWSFLAAPSRRAFPVGTLCGALAANVLYVVYGYFVTGAWFPAID